MQQPVNSEASARSDRSTALRFVLLIGVVSLFADLTYEGARSVVGPYLLLLGAGATVVSIVAGLGELLGYGLRLVCAFGVHEALDQAGALFGPLVVAAVVAWKGEYRTAFAVLLVPAIITLAILGAARLAYPQPEQMETTPPQIRTGGIPRIFWLYLAAAALVAVGFADFPLIAFRFAQSRVVSSIWIPIFYAIAQGTGGAGSLLFGRLFDKAGIAILIPLTVISALFAPLVFLGGFGVALAGSALWGLGIGVHEALIPAAVADMVPQNRRASAYGLFTAGYGVAWFLGSVVLGILYPVSISALVAFSLVAEVAAIPLFIVVRRHATAAATA